MEERALEDTPVTKELYLQYREMGLNDKEAARALGVSRYQLYEKLKKEWGLSKKGRPRSLESGHAVERQKRRYQKMVRQGMLKQDIAKELGMHIQTLARFRKKHFPEEW